MLLECQQLKAFVSQAIKCRSLICLPIWQKLIIKNVRLVLASCHKISTAIQRSINKMDAILKSKDDSSSQRWRTRTFKLYRERSTQENQIILWRNMHSISTLDLRLWWSRCYKIVMQDAIFHLPRLSGLRKVYSVFAILYSPELTLCTWHFRCPELYETTLNDVYLAPVDEIKGWSLR